MDEDAQMRVAVSKRQYKRLKAKEKKQNLERYDLSTQPSSSGTYTAPQSGSAPEIPLATTAIAGQDDVGMSVSEEARDDALEIQRVEGDTYQQGYSDSPVRDNVSPYVVLL